MQGHDVPVRVDHVGIAVDSVAEAEPVLFALGCEKLSDQAVEGNETVAFDDAGPDARFRWVYYELGDASRIELIEPLAEDSFLVEYLEANGPGLHHVTLEVADIDAMIAHLEGEGIRVVDRRDYDTWSEAFVSPRNPTGALFQLMEYGEGYETEDKTAAALFVNGQPVAEAVGEGRG